ncbi:nucleotidyltransferase domain-containing protein [Caballeronia sordidicola]|uniref:Nucleotidyltransferase n=1 Tax=Caballeronia sordidicola TaxID=196367 RepID=A0A226WKZ3_CABSO|nr:nucleotidyltransferase [Caballeronia sordidicola]OXC71793.1 hypothetical protein BSU04_45235 [Caballeronia sordidicola]
MTTNPSLSKRLIASLNARAEAQQWEQLIAKLLQRLELNPEDRASAVADYEKVADRLAQKLSIPRHDVHIFPQGSMRTQTTISQQHPVKFDLDLVVKLTGPAYDSPDPETMFEAFGLALEGNETVTGKPDPKRRCWRLQFPGKPYYFDLTPAVRDQTGREGSSLSVRDPDIRWAPSNPEEFANWFCMRAAKRFEFERQLMKAVMDSATITPLPDEEIGLDDILRRTVQLMKLHRDTMYRGNPKQDLMPISVIIVTLATNAYADLYAARRTSFSSPIELVLALVEAMPHYIQKDHTGWRVENPKLKGENFADRWNSDEDARALEFERWHARLETDLEALLHQSHRAPSEDRIRSIFGTTGLEAWKASRPRVSVLDGLIGSADGFTRSNPDKPVRTGSSNTLG